MSRGRGSSLRIGAHGEEMFNASRVTASGKPHGQLRHRQKGYGKAGKDKSIHACSPATSTCISFHTAYLAAVTTQSSSCIGGACHLLLSLFRAFEILLSSIPSTLRFHPSKHCIQT
ncbi:hypothetical protein, unlikely [Trypanosoma brucei gambiense DAL972]|uniref:Uncharacterized protein n=1 Tax=Trypanosoma brucei gambiense (strain MHOM/CI/86/DAL972) TaxID=679716 RepID=C9ZU65_TRYB9|nr:hypothetical protein, unlikely [Trypanosoma brucei gambiense DAL972]CBH12951.1 hypothetical protein, unlikely [Trypanosoma brucei gambiense DAL972]|eukprot:XP_011775230.1 hypothetical protein, unlikely [Trypanosoma brucei gambiense DAL972]